MSFERLVNAIRAADFLAYKEIVSSLPLDKLNTPNSIHYSDWFPGIGFSILQLICMVRPEYATPLIERKVEIDLHSACALGINQTIENHLKKDLSYINNSIAGFYPIQFAIKNPYALKLLLEYGDDPLKDITKLAWFDWEVKAVEKGLAQYKPMHLIAVGRGSVPSAKCLYEFGAHLDSTSSPFGEAPIHLAAIYDKASFITWLVEMGVDVDAETNQRHIEFKVGELFDESHFSPFEDSYRKTALMLAAGEGQISTVRQLIKLKANPNAKDSKGYTPLHYAAGAFWSSNLEIIELLVRAGAEVNLKSHMGLTPKDLAQKKQYSACVDLLS